MNNFNLYSQLSALPADLKKEVEDFIAFLIQKSKKSSQHQKRQAGLAKGLIKLHPNFDEPLEDFNDYT